MKILEKIIAGSALLAALAGCRAVEVEHPEVMAQLKELEEMIESAKTGGIRRLPELKPYGERRLSRARSSNRIPGLDVEVKGWNPVDVTDEVIAALKGDQINFDYRDGKLFITPDIPLVNGRSTVSGLFGSDNEHYMLIFDPKTKRVYSLGLGDKEIVGFPFPHLHYGYEHSADDQGIEVYFTFMTESESEDGNSVPAMVIADYPNSRKIVMKKPYGHFHRFGISGDASRAVIHSTDGFYVFDTDTQRVVYRNKSDFKGISHDGRFIVYNIPQKEYRLIDTKTKEEQTLWTQYLSKWGFSVSPDGNFVVCVTENHGSNLLDVLVRSTGEYFSINSNGRECRPPKIDDNGRITAVSGTYDYKNGTYAAIQDGFSVNNSLILKGNSKTGLMQKR